MRLPAARERRRLLHLGAGVGGQLALLTCGATHARSAAHGVDLVIAAIGLALLVLSLRGALLHVRHR